MAAELLIWDPILERISSAKPLPLLLSGLITLCLTLIVTFQCDSNPWTSLFQATFLATGLTLTTLSRKLVLRKPKRWPGLVVLDQCVSAIFTVPALLFLLLQALPLSDPFYSYLSLLSVSTPSLFSSWEHRYLGLSPEPSSSFLALLVAIALFTSWLSDSGSAVALGLATLSAWTLPAMMARVMSFTQSLRPLKDLFPALLVLLVMSYYALLGEGQENRWALLVSSAGVLGLTEVKVLAGQGWPVLSLVIYSGLAVSTYLQGPLLPSVYWWGVALQVGEELYCLQWTIRKAN